MSDFDYSQSILLSIKKLLGVADCDESFDTDIIIHINSALSFLQQIGIGKEEGFAITGKNETWDNFFGGKLISSQKMVVTYVYQKVKLIFDPPNSSFAIQAMKQSVEEMEWRLSVTADEKKKEVLS